MIVLAAAAVLGLGVLLLGFACWVLSMFDHASEQRALELERILRPPSTRQEGPAHNPPPPA